MSAAAGLPAQLHVFERGWLSSNNILLVGRDETALVDTGYATHSGQTLALVEAGLGDRPLDRVLNTHLHSDHCGGNAALQQRYPRARTLIPPGEADLVRSWDEDALSFRATGQQCPRFRFDGLLVPGQDVVLGDLPWQVHAAPGHDPHSIILFESGSRTLISADALWENGFGIVFPELAGEPSFDEVAATLDLIEALEPVCVIPGHGSVFNEAAAALSLARRRLEALSRDPVKHARYALKVLVKFKLLEVQTTSVEEWKAWFRSAPYFDAIRARFFASSSLDELNAEILAELAKAGAAFADEVRVQNR
ncbi:MBL fold metallo-hydrolase [Variovorax sp. MHTC-1]|uniref:MBL fold metallo-hydrolase n=1 Tax=Variovorax sp. MHTC-1 TaxID=2495593 RepID=UPI000F882D57|nr:MBL fold metallo-hydrolase [Variovorax sp. MHTC-1]RST51518.1 MBL fold metallo-hydrolase [Variovorax sp. MHTC-1]